MKSVRVALAQINTIVGDLAGNRHKILFCIDQARKHGVDVIVFPELAITGYPPEDLLLKGHFIKENLRCLTEITKATENIIAIVGFVDVDRHGIYNSAGVLINKKIIYAYHKMHLPNYGVFDEKRYFRPGTKNALIKAKDFSFIVNICEDIWVSEDNPKKDLVSQAQFLVNISASPYHVDKIKERRDLLIRKVGKIKIPICYCNLVGGQDELVFDGRSVVFGRDGKPVVKGKAFEEDLVITDLAVYPGRKIKNIEIVTTAYKTKEKRPSLPGRKPAKGMSRVEEVYSALLLGLRDYVNKNNFKKVAFGLSGGIDSAVVACIAAHALGRANVLAVSMPSRYSSKGTQDDASKLSRNLGIRFTKVPIDGILDTYINTLKGHFTGMKPDITEENIQARIRGNILMAFSNKFGYLVLNTGNKSETSVGYCTLYGDMAGGFAIIKDVSKDLVYKLARFINNREKKEVIPRSIIERAPSAELKPGQKDQDTLPPYELLDKIIDLYIEKDTPFSEIIKQLKNKAVIEKVLRMIDMNEYKRRQAPPGIKITPRAFGKDRRMPITNKFTEARYEKDDKRRDIYRGS